MVCAILCVDGLKLVEVTQMEYDGKWTENIDRTKSWIENAWNCKDFEDRERWLVALELSKTHKESDWIYLPVKIKSTILNDYMREYMPTDREAVNLFVKEFMEQSYASAFHVSSQEDLAYYEAENE